jgi:peptidoglycan/LPS O-acetylase OafA/YrhL
MKGKIEYIDFAKGYAIFTIILYHLFQKVALAPLFQKAIIFGGTGVHLFFLLSGFGLGLSKSNFSTLEFYKRRMSKIWLPYILALSLSFLVSSFLFLFKDSWAAWLAGVGLYQMFSNQYIASFGGHFWFISAIIQFYLVFPLLMKVKEKIGNNWAFFGISLLVSMIWWELVFTLEKGDQRIWNSCFLQFLWEFVLGICLADTYRKQQQAAGLVAMNPSRIDVKGDFWNYKWWIYLPIGLLFTGGMILMILKMGEIGKLFNDVPALIGYTALSIFLYHIGDKFFAPLKQFFLWISTFSFSLYLVHQLVLALYLRFFTMANVPVTVQLLLPYVGVAIFAGWAFEPLSRWITSKFDALTNKKTASSGEKMPQSHPFA